MNKLPFIPNQIVRRSEIHDRYLGNRQSGICPSSSHPFIFIFSGEQGIQHGYKDDWVNSDVFSYTGEGQIGDMRYTRGNLALKNHLNDGKRVFLFKYVAPGFVRFIGELVVFDSGYMDTFDNNNNLRKGIVFFMHRIGVGIPKSYNKFEHVSDSDYKITMPNTTERAGLVTSRVGQGAYRKGIIIKWEYKCAVTGFDKPEVLIASHIVPWKTASDVERLDVNNGILLSPVYDALFDRHLISFENSGKIILSDSIQAEAFQRIGVLGGERIKKTLNLETMPYLEKHRLAIR